MIYSGEGCALHLDGTKTYSCSTKQNRGQQLSEALAFKVLRVSVGCMNAILSIVHTICPSTTSRTCSRSCSDMAMADDMVTAECQQGALC